MKEPVRGDWLRLVKRNRWDNEHLRSHVGEIGEVTTVLLPTHVDDALQVRLHFPSCTDIDRTSLTGRKGCVQWVGLWRCET